MDGSLDNEALHNVRKLAESAKKLHFPRVYAHFTGLTTLRGAFLRLAC